MPFKDLIQTKLVDADFTAIEGSITTIETKLIGKTVSLSPEERKSYGSINEQNKLVVEKVNDYRQSSPQFNSPQIDWAEFQSDFAVRKRLELIINRLTSIAEQLSDTKILHDNDNYKDALGQYNYLGFLNTQAVPGSTSVKEDIGQFFKSMGNSGNM